MKTSQWKIWFAFFTTLLSTILIVVGFSIFLYQEENITLALPAIALFIICYFYFVTIRNIRILLYVVKENKEEQ